MKSIQRRFNNIVSKNEGWSSYLCFAGAVAGQQFSKQTLHRWFTKLVNKEDYAASDKRAVLAHLETLTKTRDDDKKHGQI